MEVAFSDRRLREASVPENDSAWNLCRGKRVTFACPPKSAVRLEDLNREAGSEGIIHRVEFGVWLLFVTFVSS